MGNYTSRRGQLTGATLWRVVADGGELRILPDGAMDLMWADGRFRFAGADTTAMIHDSRAGAVTWGLRLAPGTAHALLGIPAHELADQRFELTDLVALPSSIVDSAHSDAPAALERVCVALWTQAAPEASVVRLARSLDRAARAGIGVPEIADRHGMSERSLRRLSDKLFGYGPKTLMSIHRLQHALQLARSGMSLSDASAMAGYADQAHLARDSRRLAGTTPGVLVA